MTDPHTRYDEVLDRLRGFRESSVLIAFAELGIADAIAANCRTPDEIAEQIGADARATERFLHTAEAFGFVRREADGYANTEFAAETLTSDGPASLINMVRWQKRFYRRWEHLAEAVISGQRPESNRRDEEHPTWVSDFTRAFYDVAKLSAPSVARAMAPLIAPERTVRVVDIGGGHGGYSIALAQAYPRLEAVVFDLPPVIATTREIIAATPVAERVTTRTGDFRTDPLGEGYDIALVFGVLGSDDAETGRQLLRSVREALTPGGHVVVRVSGPTSGANDIDRALGDLHLLLSTDAGGAQGGADIEAWIAGVGFRLLPRIALPGQAGGQLLIGQRTSAAIS